MSMPERKTITCPKCGKKIECTVWASINTEMDFAIDDIKSGKLFTVICDSCGFRIKLDYPILFNDMIHSVMISYEKPDEQKSQNSESLKLFSGFMQRTLYRNGIRVVDNQNDLREKVAIFNAGFDDRVMEIYKFSIIFMFFQQNPNSKLSIPAHFNYSNGKPVIALTTEDKRTLLSPFQEDMYRVLEAKYNESLEDGNDDANAAVIDYYWAKDYVEAHMLSLMEDEKDTAEERLQQALDEIAKYRDYEAFLREQAAEAGTESIEEYMIGARSVNLFVEKNIDLQEAREIVERKREEMPPKADIRDPIVQNLLAAFEAGIISSDGKDN